MVKMPERYFDRPMLLSLEETSDLTVLRHHPAFKSIFENAMAGLALTTIEGEIIEANPSFCRLVGHTVETIVSVALEQLTHPEDWPASCRALERSLVEQREGVSRDKRFMGRDGSPRWVKMTSSCLFDAAGRALCRLVMVQDIHELKTIEDDLRRAENFWISAFNHLSDSVYIVDADSGRITWVNTAFQRDLGLSLKDVIGKSCHEIGQLRSGTHAALGDCCPLRQAISSGEPAIAEHRVVDAGGNVRVLELSLSPVRSEDGQVENIVFICRDLTRLHRVEQEAKQLACYDALTGLANRSQFHDQVQFEIDAARCEGSMSALFLLDLDHFKKINDTLGHQSGDDLLRAVASRLRQSVPQSCTVARLGGDEFAVIAPVITDANETAHLASKLLETLARPFELAGLEVFLTASIGIALYPDDGIDAATLIRNADMAMYQAKEAGRNTCRYYSAELNRNTRDRLALEGDLRHAIARNQLFLVYQPQIDLRQGHIIGVEALLRWQHPHHGMIPPGRFIQLAEESGYILPLSEWILRSACRQASAWRRAGLPEFQVAVNLSGHQFRDPALPEMVAKILQETGLPPEALELELTETTLMATGPETVKIISRLKQLGVHLAIDDFGTGYSSLLYLKHFAMDRIKIAREFVCDLNEPGNRAIVETMVAMGRNLGMEVIAEGVETFSELQTLCASGCQQVQGYYFSRPLPAAEVENFFAAGKGAIPFRLG